MNPEYEYLFFDDKACIDFIVENFPDLLQWYNKLRPGAYKADLFRLLILKKMGGVYLDIKTTCLLPLRDIIPSDIEFMSIRDILKGSVYNGVIACVPDHPIINDTIRRYIDNIKNRNFGINSLDVGGPQTLGRAVNTYLGRGELDEIPKGSINGIFITGRLRMMSNTETIFISDDEKTPLFNRTCSSYVSSKLKQMVKGKEYHSLWVFRKVYSE
jgi:hypothetical protein